MQTQHPLPQSPSSASIRPRILIVDDSTTTRMRVQQELEQAGFIVEEAANGKIALELFARVRPDLVLLDVVMPEMDGFQTCAALRDTVQGKYLPIVMLTGLEDEASIDRAYKVGATDFITKPINWVLLSHRIRYLLRASRAIREVRQKEEAFRQEVHLSTTLVQAGRDLTSSLATPIILERLCQLTTAVFDCDRGYTLLYQPERDIYTVVASYGYSPRQQDAFNMMSFPGTMISPFVKQPIHAGDISRETGEDQENVPEILLEPFALASGLFLALRRGSEVIGLHASGSQTPRAFSPQQQRLALGIAQFASLALDNARLLEQAESTTRLKSEFLSTVSHELRTPIHIILGYLDLLLEQTFGPLTTQQTSTLRQLQRSGKELLSLIDNLLQVGRLEAKKLPLDLRPIDIPTLITDIQTETSGLCDQSGLRFEWRIERALPVLCTDVSKLKMVIKNLLGNAIKFTSEGTVTITARAQCEGVEVSVSDTGPGIPHEDLRAIFDAFRQGEQVLTRQHRGVGLGLYIVRQMINLLKGSVSVDSTVGKGSTFRVWVPQRWAATQSSLLEAREQRRPNIN